MSFVKSVLKGIVVGIANVVPGVSGGTMMVSMGIYDKLIHCITHLFSEFKKSVIFLFPIGVGMVLAVIGSSFALKELFASFPIQTNLLFIGLILGGLPAVWKKVKGKTIRIGHMAAALAFFAMVAGMAAVGETNGASADVSFSVFNVLILFVVGVIASATMVIPGVSGSMVLMLLGFYTPVWLEAVPGFVKALVHLDINGLLAGCGILVPFGLGVVAGMFGVARLVELVFEKCPMYAYWAIIGLIAASPVAILLMNWGVFAQIGVQSAVTGVPALAAGIVIAVKLGD